jgi:hypothetical protein
MKKFSWEKKMDNSLRSGDRVRHKDGREGIFDRAYAEVVAFVCWDQGPPGYETIAYVSKLKAADAEPKKIL